MGELSRKGLLALFLLSTLVACQAAPTATPLVSTQPAPPPAPQSTQAQQPAPTQPVEAVLPSMPDSEDLSPTFSITPTPQGISQEMDALIPPIPPAQLAATRSVDGVLLSWLGTGSDIDTHYAIYRRPTGSQVWQVLGFVAVQGDNRGDYTYLDASVQALDAFTPAGQSLEYSVTTFDHYGKESDRAIILAATTP